MFTGGGTAKRSTKSTVRPFAEVVDEIVDSAVNPGMERGDAPRAEGFVGNAPLATVNWRIGGDHYGFRHPALAAIKVFYLCGAFMVGLAADKPSDIFESLPIDGDPANVGIARNHPVASSDVKEDRCLGARTSAKLMGMKLYLWVGKGRNCCG